MSAAVAPEIDLVHAIIAQAVRDLRPTAEVFEQLQSATFLRGETGVFQFLCGLIDADYEVLQRRIYAAFPQVLMPQQLCLALKEEPCPRVPNV